jgi:hypothetical protein
MKTIWLTSLERSEDQVRKMISQMKGYGIEIKGHFWDDNLEKMAWVGAREELSKPDLSAWLILASQEKLAIPSIRYGLALLGITLQAKKGIAFPTAMLFSGGELPSPDTFPTPLKGGEILSSSDPSVPAKLVAMVHRTAQKISSEYRLDVYGTPEIGQWFEIGPLIGIWPGAMFGITEGEIRFHAVGPKEKLPSQSVLQYPLKGLRLSLGGKEYTAWAVQNELDPQASYFVKVEGFPSSILFGAYSSREEAEAYVVRLK